MALKYALIKIKKIDDWEIYFVVWYADFAVSLRFKMIF